MRKVIDYKIVPVEEVKDLLILGWEPLGSPFFEYLPEATLPYFPKIEEGSGGVGVCIGSGGGGGGGGGGTYRPEYRQEYYCTKQAMVKFANPDLLETAK